MADLKRNLPSLYLLMKDCEIDAIRFDGKPFTGNTLAEIHGILEAKIFVLAKVLTEVIEDQPSHLEKIQEALKRKGL